MQIHPVIRRTETDAEEHDRLVAERTRIARLFGHQPLTAKPARLLPPAPRVAETKAVARG